MSTEVQVSGGSAGSTSQHDEPHFGPNGWCDCLCPECQSVEKDVCICAGCRECGDR